MNKPLIWIAAGVAGIGFAIPAYAAMSNTTGPGTTPASTVVTTPELGDTTTSSSTPTDATNTRVTTSTDAPLVTTATSIEDISGPCDEAEHATDDRCTGTDAGAGAEDNSGHDGGEHGHGGDDDGDHSGHGGGDDD